MNSKYISSLILSFFTPLLVLWQGIKSSNNSYKRFTVTLFFAFYGSTIMISPGNDGFRHRLKVYEVYTDLSLDDFSKDIYKMLLLKETVSGGEDLYKHVVSYFVGAVLNMPSLFFVIIALIYGYFFSGAMMEVFSNFGSQKKNFLLLSFALLFFISKNLEGVNTVRTWTALWVLFYGVVKYYKTYKLKYLFLMFAPPLIHIGYSVIILPVIVYLIFGTRPLVYSIVFVLSSFVNIINPQSAVQQLNETELGESKVKGYHRKEKASIEKKYEDQMEKTGGNQRWYKTLKKLGIGSFALNTLIYGLIFFRYYPLKMSKHENVLFSIGLLILTLSNSTWFISALTARTALIGKIFLLASFVIFMQRTEFHLATYSKPVLMKLLLRLSLILHLPNFFFSVSMLFDYPSIFIIFAPFAVWTDESLNVSIKEAIRFLTGLGQ